MNQSISLEDIVNIIVEYLQNTNTIDVIRYDDIVFDCDVYNTKRSFYHYRMSRKNTSNKYKELVF